MAALLAKQTVFGVAQLPDDLPTGALRVGEVEVKLGAPVFVEATADPKKPVALPVPAGPASHLIFVHTMEPGRALHEYRLAVALAHRKIELPAAAPVALRYLVKYADGMTLEVPVRWGEGIEQRQRVGTVGPMLWAKPITTGQATFYAMEWPNPRPGQPVASVAVARSTDSYQDYGRAVVWGVTAVNRPATGKTYFVQPPPFGDDAQPGTFEQPWASLHQAAKVAQAGDTVYVRGGYYVLSRPVVITKSGAPGKWVTYSAFPGETPVFDAFGVLYDTRLQPYNEKAPRDRYQHDTGVIDAPNSPTYLRIQGLHIQRSRRAAISAYGKGAEGRGQFVEINFNTVDRAFSMGIITHEINDLRIIGNRLCRPHSDQMVFDPFTGEPAATSELPQESIDLSRNTRFEIAFNEVYGSAKEAIDCISVQDGRIHDNYIHSSLNGIYIDSWTIPIERVEIDRNFIHNAFVGIPLSTEGGGNLLDFQIHHNIVIESKAGGINVSEATYKAKPASIQRIAMFNNTVDRDGGHATGIGWFSSGLRVAGFDANEKFKDVFVFNNIATRSAQTPLSCSFTDLVAHNLQFTHNLLFPAEDRTPQWIRERDPKAYDKYRMVLGEKTVTKDPLYVNPERGDYRLRPGSPAIGAGVAVKNGRPDPTGKPSDLGALPFGTSWLPGFDFAGKVTAYYRGELVYQPVSIPREKFTLHRNHLQRPSWFQIGRYGPDLQHLPAGDQCWAGIDWFVAPEGTEPTVLALGGLGAEGAPAAITAVPVGRKADTLAFLQTYHVGAALNEAIKEKRDNDLTLFRYVVHYADGSSATVPVIWKQHIDRWQENRVQHLPGARLAWSLPGEGKRGSRWNIQLYAFEWTNPHPDRVIATLDLVSANTPELNYGSPAVLAISTGRQQ